MSKDEATAFRKAVTSAASLTITATDNAITIPSTDPDFYMIQNALVAFCTMKESLNADGTETEPFDPEEGLKE